MYNRMYIRIIYNNRFTAVFPAYAGVSLAGSFPQQFPLPLTLLIQNKIYQNIKRLVYCQCGEYKISSKGDSSERNDISL